MKKCGPIDLKCIGAMNVWHYQILPVRRRKRTASAPLERRFFWLWPVLSAVGDGVSRALLHIFLNATANDKLHCIQDDTAPSQRFAHKTLDSRSAAFLVDIRLHARGQFNNITYSKQILRWWWCFAGKTESLRALPTGNRFEQRNQRLPLGCKCAWQTFSRVFGGLPLHHAVQVVLP